MKQTFKRCVSEKLQFIAYCGQQVEDTNICDDLYV